MARGLYVQFGSHFCAPDGWLNFDASPMLRLERVPVLGRFCSRNGARFPANVRYGDIVKGLPVRDNAVDGLYASHVLEHLALEDCGKALANCHGMLKPGGRFRLVVPDLKVRAERYVAANDAEAALVFMASTGLGRARRARNPVARAGQVLGNSAHLWMWDEAAMAAALRRAGFSRIRRCAFGDSDDPMFQLVESETRFVSEGLTELAIEAVK